MNGDDETALHRLHRDPARVAGLSDAKKGDHAPSPSEDARSADAPKPYSTEVEDATDPSIRPPTDPVARRDARWRTPSGPRR